MFVDVCGVDGPSKKIRCSPCTWTEWTEPWMPLKSYMRERLKPETPETKRTVIKYIIIY